MALPVAIVIGGVIKLAAPHVARFLVKHGFKKASQTAVRGKTKIPSVSSRQAKDIVNKEQQTSSELKKQIKELRGKSLRLQKEGNIPKGALIDTLKKLEELKRRAHKLGSQEKKLKAKKSEIERKEKKTPHDKESDIRDLQAGLRKFIRREEIRQRREEDLVRWRAELKDRYKIDTSDWSDARIKDMGSRLERRKQGLPSELPELGIEAEKILLKRQRRQPHQKAKTKAKELTDDPSLQKFLESGPREFKKGGRIGRPKGVGKALRGYGKAMKRGKH